MTAEIDEESLFFSSCDSWEKVIVEVLDFEIMMDRLEDGKWQKCSQGNRFETKISSVLYFSQTMAEFHLCSQHRARCCVDGQGK